MKKMKPNLLRKRQSRAPKHSITPCKVGPSKHWDVAMDDEFSLERGKGFHTLDNEDEILLSFDGGDGMGEEAPNPTSRDASSSGKGKDVEDLIDDSDEE
ncbi:hypothetical protein IFM89_006157 [Coptis chinensis]|uniref:Uncharacterized protein n=1 Tax=Coptis chinensis TaxID=261450 RepID=A0A835LA97_9MAGN|nr:hypothetical protein IFM89_006157 [Coptis chinensis]